jgi:hypothetical protein
MSNSAITPTMKLKGAYMPVLTNMRRTPYRTGSNDQIQVKLEIFKRKRLINIAGVDVQFWMNFSDTWLKYEDYTTTRFGNKVMNYPCSAIPEINNCLAFARVIIDGESFDSNIIRLNFIEGWEPTDLVYKIDALDDDTDRTSFDIFDGSGRDNTYNRMFGF